MVFKINWKMQIKKLFLKSCRGKYFNIVSGKLKEILSENKSILSLKEIYKIKNTAYTKI